MKNFGIRITLPEDDPMRAEHLLGPDWEGFRWYDTAEERDDAEGIHVAVLEEVRDIIAVNAERKGLRILLDLPEDLPPALRGDETRLLHQQRINGFLHAGCSQGVAREGFG